MNVDVQVFLHAFQLLGGFIIAMPVLPVKDMTRLRDERSRTIGTLDYLLRSRPFL